jgi:hypothetical protein
MRVRSWRMVLIVAAVVAGAVAASGDVEVIPAALLVGAVLVGVNLAVRRGLNRLLPAPEVPDDATPGERARLMRPYVLGWMLVVVVLTAGAFGLAVAFGGPSTLGAVYLSLPLVFVLVMGTIALRRARD